ncbi:fimbria/pilus periplasmic chaperone [Oleiagrimonas sp. C23AA]|uniref:fimbrial biogenesis chaperone n=1 Tax=Oleiagrimonas sp. C23AA TaxID=2719047 RepID=UPI00141F3B8C|nr:fimbria/pilus periplasmic chaperone [Oleiagrimonas sp. C23AA]NII09426.1 molecular chaperone [Oleiagrimonas sp. C23AA]
MRISGIALVALFGIALGKAHADAISVSPTTLKVSGRGGMLILHVANRGDAPVVAQVEGFTWVQTNGRNRLKPNASVEISPPLMQLNPGKQQLVRIAVPAVSDGREHTYRLIVSELPNASAGQGVHVLLRISVPVFENTPSNAAPRLSWSLDHRQGRWWLQVKNSGLERAKLTHLAIQTSDGRTAPVSDHALHYVLAGSRGTWPLEKISLSVGQHVSVHGIYADSGKTLNVDLDVPALVP